MAASDKIRFHFLVPPFYFPNRTKLKGFLLNLFKSEGYTVDFINYIFCSDAFLLNINRQYLKHNTYTDIVTFLLSENMAPIASDIYISVERVKENAKVFQVTFLHELHRVIFHGVLHLCGYSDKNQKQKEKMRLKEDYYLNLYFVSREKNEEKL